MRFSKLTSQFRKFSKDDSGAVTVEAIIVLPILLWLFGVGWVYFDAFRQQNVNQKANYVIADMISRETNELDATYITNAYNLLKLLDDSMNSSTDMRVSVVQYVNKENEPKKWDVKWSKSRGSVAALSEINNEMKAKLPDAMHTEQLIIVETWEDYSPVFRVGLNAFEIKTFSFTSPRYTAQVLYSDS